MRSFKSAELLEVTTPGLAYICLGGFVVAFSMLSLIIKEKLYINEVVLGTGFGVLIGPYVGNVLNPRPWTDDVNFLTQEITRIVLVTGLFAIGVELPRSYMARHAKSLLVMVVPTMAIGWLIVAGVMYGLFQKLSFVSCLAIAACLTPTDPVICATIVGGKWAAKHVPLNLRRILSAESAANDGLAFPFLALAMYLTLDSSGRDAISDWVVFGWLYQVMMGTVIGAVIGLAFSHLMKFSHNKGFIDRESYVAQFLALAIFVAGVVSTLGSDDLLAAFAAGSAISWDGNFNEHTEGEVFASVIDLVLNCACFVYIGAWLPFNSFNSPDLGVVPWRLSLLCVATLFLRRIPAIFALYKWVPEIRNWREALFSGHFGPMGVGAIFVSCLATSKLPAPHDPPRDQKEILAATLQPIVAFVVLGSIIIHGLSIPFFTLSRNTTVSLTNTLTALSGPNRVPEWLSTVRDASSLGGKLPVPPGEPEEGIQVAEVRETQGESSKSTQIDLEARTTILKTTNPGEGNQVTRPSTQQSVRFPPRQ